MGYLSCPENTVWLAASKAIRFIRKAARTCNSVSHLLKSVVREIRMLRCVGQGSGDRPCDPILEVKFHWSPHLMLTAQIKRLDSLIHAEPKQYTVDKTVPLMEQC